MANDENKIILEFPATNVEIEFGETITFDNISGFLDSGRVTYNGDSLTEEIADLEDSITDLEDSKADTTYVDTELAKKADKSNTYTKSEVDTLIDNLPEPMIFKGTLGVGGTIQTLPTASASNEGWTYKVITDGTYAGQTAKDGDMFTSNGSDWVLIPSGDEDNDTWRAIKVNGVEKLGNGISSGAVDFEDTANVKFEFDANGNKVRARLDGIYTESDVDELLDDKADADNTYTKEQVDDIVYNILPDDTASGSVANFTTSLELPIKSLEVDVNAVQEAGTPTSASPLPISGWNTIRLYQRGANLFDKTNVIDGYYINDVDGTQRQNTGDKCTDFIEIKPNTAYFIYSEQTAGRWGAWYDKDKNFISGINLYGVRTAPANAKYARFTVVRNGNGNSDTFSVNYPSSDTEHHAYNPNSNTEVINLGGTYYGAELMIDKYGHRTLKVVDGFKTFTGSASENWYYYALDTGSLFRISVSERKSGYITSTMANANAYLCNQATKASNNTYGRTNGTFSGGVHNLDVVNNNFTDLASWKTYLASNPLQFKYELETPIIIDLPDGEPIATLIGTNNIYADTGDTSVVFKDSVNGYVEKKIASVQALALNT